MKEEKDRRNPLNVFFGMGEKITKGDPVRKAQFDYYLYWIVFLAFLFLALNYVYNFIMQPKFSILMWAIILGVISWFNYWGLIGFRKSFLNLKEIYSIQKKTGKKQEIKIESEEEMLEEFRDEKP